MTQLRQSPSGPFVHVPSFTGASNANVGAAAQIDWSKGPSQNLTLTANCNVSSIGLPPGENTWVQLVVIQGGAGGYTPTILGALTPGDAPLALSTAPGSVDVVSLFWNGTFFLAQVAGLDYR